MFAQSAKPHTSASQVFWFIVGIVLFEPLCRDLSEGVSNNFYGNTSDTLFRFRDFEPRSAGVAATAERKTADTREARGFSFHADNQDLQVDLEFTVPLVRIPVQRSMKAVTSTFQNLVNLNTGTLLTSGAFVAVGAVAAAAFKVFQTPVLVNYGYTKSTRAAGGATMQQLMDPFSLIKHGGGQFNGSTPTKSVTKVNDFVGAVEEKLQQHDIDVAVCIQRSICSYVRHASSGVRVGKASAIEKIIDGLASLDVLRGFLSGSAVQHAIDVGRSSNSCDQVYRSCKWTQPQNKILPFIMNYLKYFNG